MGPASEQRGRAHDEQDDRGQRGPRAVVAAPIAVAALAGYYLLRQAGA